MSRYSAPIFALLHLSSFKHCQWVADHSRVYLVQIDQEGEDIFGVNPFQIRVPPAHQPAAASGNYLLAADEAAIRAWDKLLVLTQLWDETAIHRPTLLYVALAKLPESGDAEGAKKLEDDFGRLIGPNNIVVRTSVRAGGEKIVNLRRTEGLTPSAAAKWCLDTRDQFRAQGGVCEDWDHRCWSNRGHPHPAVMSCGT